MATPKLPKQKYPIVLLVWEDIYSPDKGWIKPEKAHEEAAPCLISSVGYLISDTSDYVFYASDIADDGTANGVTQVPRGNVRHMKVIRNVKEKATKVPSV